MTGDERARITSNDYVDLIIEWNNDMRVFDRFPDSSPHIMNERYAVVYIPAAQLNQRAISQFGYRVLPFAFSLESSRSLEASGVNRLRRLAAFNLRGQGVLIGIIDTGIDYTNPVFIKQDGTTKIAALWDQTIESDNFPETSGYGTEYSAEDINQALANENPLSIVPSTDEIGHGTMLAGIAAGSEISGSDFSGVAPDSELVIVKLKQIKDNLRNFFFIPEGVPCYQENDIMWAYQYIIDIAAVLGKPVSICIGLGSSQGSHDGLGALSSLVTVGGDFTNVVTTVSAGNEGNARRHFYSEIDRTVGSTVMEINVGEDETGFILEIWGQAPNTYSVDILSPNGEYIPRIPEGLWVSRDIGFVFERTRINLYYNMVDSTAGDQLILLRFDAPTPGIWTIRIYTIGDLKGVVNSWLPSDNFISTNTYFIQSNPYTTITAPGDSEVPITVTAYNPDNNNLYQRASRGYTRIGVIKPEIAAPGVNIRAPDLNHGFTTMTGTGAAAAHTTGISALILEWGIVRNNYPDLDSVSVKKFLIRGAQTNPNLVYPNRDWGYGMLDIYNVFNIFRTGAQPV